MVVHTLCLFNIVYIPPSLFPSASPVIYGLRLRSERTNLFKMSARVGNELERDKWELLHDSQGRLIFGTPNRDGKKKRGRDGKGSES